MGPNGLLGGPAGAAARPQGVNTGWAVWKAQGGRRLGSGCDVGPEGAQHM